MPRHAYGFYALFTYLMEYAFAFILRKGNSPPATYAYSQYQQRKARDRQTDRQTNTGPHFIIPPPYRDLGIIVIKNN